MGSSKHVVRRRLRIQGVRRAADRVAQCGRVAEAIGVVGEGTYACNACHCKAR